MTAAFWTLRHFKSDTAITPFGQPPKQKPKYQCRTRGRNTSRTSTMTVFKTSSLLRHSFLPSLRPSHQTASATHRTTPWDRSRPPLRSFSKTVASVPQATTVIAKRSHPHCLRSRAPGLVPLSAPASLDEGAGARVAAGVERANNEFAHCFV